MKKIKMGKVGKERKEIGVNLVSKEKMLKFNILSKFVKTAIGKVAVARGIVKIGARGGGEVNAAKMKHLVAGITKNTSGTLHRDRYELGKTRGSFEEKLVRAQELID